MGTQTRTQFSRGRLLAALSVLTFGLTALTAVVGLGVLTPVIFVLGFFIVLPLIAILGDSLPFVESGDGGNDDERAAATDPVEQLRTRYARGELTHEEFEHRLERLLETEDVRATGSREPAFERE